MSLAVRDANYVEREESNVMRHDPNAETAASMAVNVLAMTEA